MFWHRPLAYLIPLGLQVGFSALVWRAGAKVGRSPNFAGWLLGPAVGVIAAALWLAAMGLGTGGLLFDYAPLYAPDSLSRWLIPLVLTLGLASLQLGVASRTRAARGAGLQAPLGLAGALALGLAGLVEAHRCLNGAWVMFYESESGRHWPLVEESWQLKVWVLRYAVLISALLSLAVWRRRASVAPSAKEGLRAVLLTFGVVAALALAWISVDRMHDLGAAAPLHPWEAPRILEVDAETTPTVFIAPFPHRFEPNAVIDAYHP
ncbi:MAG: hypothetical protein H6740_06970 [Alphaproteobacteria bacterium]|nr:hypothetical protein [Alphaproteobacteria bacterium]